MCGELGEPFLFHPLHKQYLSLFLASQTWLVCGLKQSGHARYGGLSKSVTEKLASPRWSQSQSGVNFLISVCACMYSCVCYTYGEQWAIVGVSCLLLGNPGTKVRLLYLHHRCFYLGSDLSGLWCELLWGIDEI